MIQHLEQKVEGAPQATGLIEILGHYRKSLAVESAPLSFLAQFNCADCPELELYIPLPSKGLLSFFYDCFNTPWGYEPNAKDGWRVLFTPDPPPTTTSPPPDLDQHGIFKECSLHFHQRWNLPSRTLLKYNNFDLPWDQYDSLLDKLNASDAVLHRLGGRPDEIQGPMQLKAQLASHGVYLGDPTGYNDPRVPALEPGAADWRLLLQLDSDKTIPWMWGDAGRLYFWSRHQDLSRQAFDNSWCILQCY